MTRYITDAQRRAARHRSADTQREMLCGLASRIVGDALDPQSARAELHDKVIELTRRINYELQKLTADAVLESKDSRPVRLVGKEELRDTAFHEAAHAVYAVDTGIRFDYAIVRDDGSGIVTIQNGDEHDFATQIMVYMVGAIGAAQFHTKWEKRYASLRGDRLDRAKIAELIAELPPVWRSLGDIDRIESYFDVQAERYVRANSHRIQAVGDELLRHRTLTEAQVKNILEQIK